MRLAIVPFSADHLDGAAALLAARQRRERLLQPDFPAQYEQPREARTLIEQQLHPTDATPMATGAAAVRGSEVVGYLLATKMLTPPALVRALFYEARSVSIGLAGYALEPDDTGDTLRELYGRLASQWVNDGYFAHYAEAAVSDRPSVDAWFSLGFGQNQVHGLRDTGPVADARAAADLEIHEAGVEDISEIVRLAVALNAYHSGSPMFQIYAAETDTDLRQDHERLLADPLNAHWLAYRHGRPVGLQVYTPPRPGVHTAERSIYLRQGFSEAAARAGGVGSALLDRAMAWAREQGYDHCSVSWLSNNLLGARFWQARGFRPTGYRLHRKVDERIAWAHGSA